MWLLNSNAGYVVVRKENVDARNAEMRRRKAGCSPVLVAHDKDGNEIPQAVLVEPGEEDSEINKCIGCCGLSAGLLAVLAAIYWNVATSQESLNLYYNYA